MKCGKVVLVTGGCRSGKSDYALKCCEKERFVSGKVFIATCPVTDNEIKERIEKHKVEREGLGWKTIEEQINIIDIIETIEEGSVILIDCLTLWINNLMFYSQNDLFEGEIKLKVNEIVESVRKNNNIIYLVTNEIGMGLVPSDKKTRLYRDLVGACNRKVAELADEVVLVCCGIPQRIKTIRDV